MRLTTASMAATTTAGLFALSGAFSRRTLIPTASAFAPPFRAATLRRPRTATPASAYSCTSAAMAQRSTPFLVRTAPVGGMSSSSRLFSSQVEEEVDPGVVEGTDLRVLKYPHPSLRAPNDDVTDDELADGSISKIAKEMFLVMYAAKGVGLAAPQVGINKRLMVYNEFGDPKKWLKETVLVNPRIVEYGPGTDVESEGCLSFPDMNGEVSRSKWIKVEALSLKGKKIKKKYKGWEARIFQHEYDHLDGVVYIDRLAEETRAEVQPRLDELVEEFGEGGSL